MITAPYLLKETSWGKTFHLSTDDKTALCGKAPECSYNHHGERSAFDAAGLEDHYCKRCVKTESKS